MKIQDVERYLRDYVKEHGRDKTRKRHIIFSQKDEVYNKARFNIDNYTVNVDFECTTIYIVNDIEMDSEDVTDYKVLTTIPEIFNIFEGK